MAESWSPAKQSANPQSVSLSYRCSAWSALSRSSASSVTGHVYLEKYKAGGEEEKESAYQAAPDTDSAVILALCHENLRIRRELRVCFQRAIYRHRELSFLSFIIQACSILRHWRHDLLWLESSSATDVEFLIVGLALASKRRRIESGKILVFSVCEWQKCSCQFDCHPLPFRANFVCAYAALHRVLSFSITHSHKPL